MSSVTERIFAVLPVDVALHVVVVFSGPLGNAQKRFLCYEYRNAHLFGDKGIQALEQCSAAGKDNAPLDNIGTELRRCFGQSVLYSYDDGVHRIFESLPDLQVVNLNSPRQSGNGIGTADFHLLYFSVSV